MAIALFQWVMMGMVSIVHPFFISMTDINYNSANKSVEVSVRIFSNDFEETLKKQCDCKVELSRPTNKPAMEKLVSSYISNHLQVKIDGSIGTLQFAGYQEEDGSIWSYFEIKNVSFFKKIEINNSLLYDYKQEQINMVHIKANGKDQSNKVEYPTPNLSFTF